MVGSPKNSVTGTVTARGLDGEGFPAVTRPPVVVPRPVAKIVSGSSREAGCDLSTRLPSLWKMAGPLASTKIAGAYFETVTVTVPEAPCPLMGRTTSGYRPAARVGGIWALI